MPDIILINSHNGKKTVVDETYPNTTAYIAKSEYDKTYADFNKVSVLAAELTKENDDLHTALTETEERLSDLRHQCMVHEECRRDIEEKYAQAKKRIEELEERLKQTPDNHTAAANEDMNQIPTRE